MPPSTHPQYLPQYHNNVSRRIENQKQHVSVHNKLNFFSLEFSKKVFHNQDLMHKKLDSKKFNYHLLSYLNALLFYFR